MGTDPSGERRNLGLNLKKNGKIYCFAAGFFWEEYGGDDIGLRYEDVS